MKFAVTQAICIGAVLLGVTGVTAMGISMVNTLQAQAADEVQAVSNGAQTAVVRLTEAAESIREKNDADQDAKVQQMIDDALKQFAEEEAAKRREEAEANRDTEEEGGVTAGADTGEPGFNEP